MEHYAAGKFLRILLSVAWLWAAVGAARAEQAAARSVERQTSEPHSSEPYDWATWRQFWSFQPVKRPQPPAAKDAAWVRNPIDAFILARLEAEGFAPAAEAEKLTLIRRLTFDLTGLPPTPEEIRPFLADKSPDAYEKLVDRLLASPHYGERWGRHWLDVARYSPGRISFPGVKDTSGDAAYRDYVVRAFNTDKPYDQFLTEQLAGDLLPPAADRQQHYDQIIAPAFLSIGGWFDMCTDPNRLRLEMVDEMVNTTTQAFMGLSVSCARCHDHKFDPIPTADYYALGGIFRSTRLVGDFSEFWRDGRVRQLRPLAMPDEVAANDQVRARIREKKDALWAMLTEEHAKRVQSWQSDEQKYREAAAAVARPFVEIFEAEEFDGQDNLRIAQLMRDGVAVEVIETQTPQAQWVKYKPEVPQAGTYRLEALYSTDEKSPLLVQVNGETVTETALAEGTGGWDLAHQRWEEVATFELRKGLNFLRLNLEQGNFPRIDRFRLVGVDESVEQQIQQLASSAGAKLDPLILRNFVIDSEHPWPTIAGIVAYLDSAQLGAIEQINREMDALAEEVAPYPLTVAVTDQPEPVDLPVHIRGETYQTSEANVPRGVLRLFETVVPPPAINPSQSGRLELARWLTDRNHPLTSRVMANRIWHWHFGQGIVKTTSDFGSRGEPPTHPELLDWLAAEFMESGWSIKHLHRLIVTSATYRQSAIRSVGPTKSDNPQSEIDGLLASFPRRRLEAEAIYDAMRSTTNMIPRQASGEPLDWQKSKQRAMYVLTSGTAPQGLGVEVRKLFPLFDYEMSAVPLPVRPASSTPGQSLFFMNNPLPKYMATKFAERLLKMDRLDDPKRLEMAYLLALGRPPTKEMAEQTLGYLEQCVNEDGMTRVEAWTNLCQALYGTAEFRYIE